MDLMRKYGTRGAQAMLEQLRATTLRWELGEITPAKAMADIGDVFNDADLPAALLETMEAIANLSGPSGGTANLASLDADIDPVNVEALAEDGLISVVESCGKQVAVITQKGWKAMARAYNNYAVLAHGQDDGPDSKGKRYASVTVAGVEVEVYMGADGSLRVWVGTEDAAEWLVRKEDGVTPMRITVNEDDVYDDRSGAPLYVAGS